MTWATCGAPKSAQNFINQRYSDTAYVSEYLLASPASLPVFRQLQVLVEQDTVFAQAT